MKSKLFAIFTLLSLFLTLEAHAERIYCPDLRAKHSYQVYTDKAFSDGWTGSNKYDNVVLNKPSLKIIETEIGWHLYCEYLDPTGTFMVYELLQRKWKKLEKQCSIVNDKQGSHFYCSPINQKTPKKQLLR